MADDEARGATAWRDVMGWDPPPRGDAFMDMTADHVFGNVWTRDGLTRRERRLVTLTAIATAGHNEILPLHMAAALRSGDVEERDMTEWIIHLAHYSGWPAAATAFTALNSAKAERDSAD